jgi:hypothetical protein
MICSPRFFSDASAIELGWEILGHNQTNSVRPIEPRSGAPDASPASIRRYNTTAGTTGSGSLGGKRDRTGLAAIGRDILGHHTPSASARPNSAPPAQNNTSG